jgi:hypothetical protein
MQDGKAASGTSHFRSKFRKAFDVVLQTPREKKKKGRVWGVLHGGFSTRLMGAL